MGTILSAGLALVRQRTYAERMEDTSYRTCPQCGADLSPIPVPHGARVLFEFTCPEHGVHTLIDPFAGKPPA